MSILEAASAALHAEVVNLRRPYLNITAPDGITPAMKLAVEYWVDILCDDQLPMTQIWCVSASAFIYIDCLLAKPTIDTEYNTFYSCLAQPACSEELSRYAWKSFCTGVDHIARVTEALESRPQIT